LSRLDTQNEDAIDTLNNQLQTNEADTFAGLWLQHEPKYRVVVAFTHNGDETIQKYVANNSELANLIEVRPAEYTYAQLQADQQTVLEILDQLQLSVGVGILVQKNQVDLGTADRAALDAALAEANIQLPESVTISTFYKSVGETPPFAITPVPDVFMPQLKQRDASYMAALIIGELIVQDGCLRILSEGESTLVIWQADYFLTDNNGLLQVLDETAEVVAQVGETIYLGGGEQSTIQANELREPIPELCGGPYWRMGEFLPEEFIPNVAGDLQLETQNDEAWLRYQSTDLDFAIEYPAGWHVHDSMGKSLEISQNEQPSWSSIYEADFTWPLIYTYHNLNHQMGGTPETEIELLLSGYEGKIEAIEQAAPLSDRSDVVVGIYRLEIEEDVSAIFLGAVENKSDEAIQPVVSMSAFVDLEEVDEFHPIFEHMLRSIEIE